MANEKKEYIGKARLTEIFQNIKTLFSKVPIPDGDTIDYVIGDTLITYTETFESEFTSASVKYVLKHNAEVGTTISFSTSDKLMSINVSGNGGTSTPTGSTSLSYTLKSVRSKNVSAKVLPKVEGASDKYKLKITYRSYETNTIKVADSVISEIHKIATTDEVGLVKPDDDTIKVATDGTLSADVNAIINSLGTGDALPIDTDYMVTQTAGGGDNKYWRRPMSALWGYIKNKLESGTDKVIRINVTNTDSMIISNYAIGFGVGSSGRRGIYDFGKGQWLFYVDTDNNVKFNDGAHNWTPTELYEKFNAKVNTSDTIAIAHGGTGATSASSARTNLGLGGASTYGATSSVTSGSSNLVTSGGVYSYALAKGSLSQFAPSKGVKTNIITIPAGSAYLISLSIVSNTSYGCVFIASYLNGYLALNVISAPSGLNGSISVSGATVQFTSTYGNVYQLLTVRLN